MVQTNCTASYISSSLLKRISCVLMWFVSTPLGLSTNRSLYNNVYSRSQNEVTAVIFLARFFMCQFRNLLTVREQSNTVSCILQADVNDYWRLEVICPYVSACIVNSNDLHDFRGCMFRCSCPVHLLTSVWLYGVTVTAIMKIRQKLLRFGKFNSWPLIQAQNVSLHSLQNI